MNSEIIDLTLYKLVEGRDVKITYKVARLDAEEVVSYIRCDQVEACKEGCPNYGKNWSCPPYAKGYVEVKEYYRWAYLIAVSTQMEEYVGMGVEPQVAIRSASGMLKAELDKVVYKLENQWKGYALLSGTCNLCKTCNCTLGLPCKNPESMRYSMEATGLDVSGLMEDKMNMLLLWYDNKTLPKYTVIVSMILTNEELESTKLKMILK